MSARSSEFRMSSVDEDCASVTLDPLEHEWMMCTADGEWDSLQRLLECEPTLISKKDFVTGFTCLHWAAKQGKHELFAMLVDFAKRHGVAINVNARSSAGYTPLHLAAMHNHIEVMKLLVGAYDADVDVRDYSGKKAAQYLRSSDTCDIKDIIGACVNSDTENASGAGRWKLPKVLQSNLNALRLLNHPEEMTADAQPRPRSLYRKSSISRIRLQRNRFKTQIVHSTSFRENEEGEESLKSPVKSRPLSNLFG
ncbi:ankyrin repeat domain-containing protein SOWAHC-like [Sinocyclocheilus rhinocerous]|uniref:ankyrin repeat domain-containing protein SOWAHC-like n=1 Tax=Sinocyclocheilus rhinocerous TaxID=307959 RepID=UPI0007B7F814|nr:PREDICTED: ankyrin repeat domain-containing protein SOWAHC-like [Sinocyclocheilus rhinocerous]